MRTSVDVRFEKGDPVREYWLAHGEGFAVENRRGRVVGQVVDVVVDPDDQRVLSLVVRRALGVSELPADQIQAVVPARDAFVLDGAGSPEPRPRRERRAPRLRPAVRAAGRRIAPLVARLAVSAAVGIGRADRILRSATIVAVTWAVGLARWAAYATRVLAAHGRRRIGELLEARRQ